MAKSKNSRMLLKLSGESFCKPGGFGIDGAETIAIAKRLIKLRQLNLEVSIVVGGGNFLRGAKFAKDIAMPRNIADYMGMLATIMNACALKETLEKLGQSAKVLSAVEVPALCEPFIQSKAIEHLKNNRIVILAGGTGNPFFTTDTCAALRACELDVNLLIKATKVDGVYSDDPNKNPNSKLFDKLSYDDILRENLKIIDHSAVSLCKENNIKIVVLNIFKEGNIEKAVRGEKVGTMIS